MRVIDVENYPRGAIRYIRYLAARRCPRCGAVLTYFYDKPPVTLPGGGRATLVELRCPRCDLPLWTSLRCHRSAWMKMSSKRISTVKWSTSPT